MLNIVCQFCNSEQHLTQEIALFRTDQIPGFFFSACVEASVEAQLLEYIYIAIYVTKGSRLRGGYRERVIHALSTVYAGTQCKPARGFTRSS